MVLAGGAWIATHRGPAPAAGDAARAHAHRTPARVTAIIGAPHGRRHRPRPPGGLRDPRRPAADRRLRRRGGRARARHARLRVRRGRPARPRARLPRRAGRPPRRARRGRVRLQGAARARPCCGCSRRRGSAATSPRAASCTWRCTPASRPSAIYLHGNAKSRAELRDGASRPGSGRSCSTTPRRRCGCRSSSRRAASSACSCASPPASTRDTHEAILTGQAGSKFGFAPDDARALIADPPAGLRIAGLHMHLGSQLFALEPYRRAIRALGTLGEFPVLRPRRRARRALHGRRSPARRARPGCAGMVEAAHARARRRGRELVLEPGRALVANAGVTLYGVESVKAGAAAGAARRRRRRHVRQPAPDALRRRLRGARRRRAWAPAAWRHGRRQALRVRRRARARRPAARSAPRRRDRDPGDRRLRLRARQQLQRPAPPAGGLLLGRDARAWWCAGRPTRSCMAATYEPFRVGLLGHGTVGAAFEPAAGAARGRGRSDRRPAPADQRRAHALAAATSRRSSPAPT